MPTIKVTVPKGTWSTDEKAEMVSGLTDAFVTVGANAGKGDITPHVTVQIEETAPGGYAVGGVVIA
ncbi:MAG: tautomerase family protein [Pseudomonadota bacterium]